MRSSAENQCPPESTTECERLQLRRPFPKKNSISAFVHDLTGFSRLLQQWMHHYPWENGNRDHRDLSFAVKNTTHPWIFRRSSVSINRPAYSVPDQQPVGASRCRDCTAPNSIVSFASTNSRQYDRTVPATTAAPSLPERSLKPCAKKRPCLRTVSALSR